MTLYKPKDRLLLGGTILLGGLSSLLAAFVSIFLQRVIDVAVAGEIREFYRVLGGMAAFLLAFGVISFSEALLGKILLRNVTRYLRGRVFKGVMKQDPKEYTAQNTADYLSALVNDVKLVEDNYLVPLLLCFQMAVLFLATLGILLYLSPLVTFILLLFLVLLFAVPALMGKKLQERQDAYSAQLSSFTAAAKDFLNGYEVIRGYSALHCILGRFHKVNKDTADKKFAADRLMAVNESFSDIFSSLTVIVIVFVAAWQMMQGKVSMGTLLALIQLSGTFVTPVVILMQNIPKIQGIKPVMEHLAELMDISRNEGEDSSRQEYEMQGLQDAIRCTDLTFSYADDQKVLEHEDFLFEAGKKYAVVGQSGCGKSTLIKLLTGYFRDFQGQIEIDGHSLKEMPQEEINRRIAVIHQNVFLFDTDIRDNICLGRQYSDEEIHKALMESGMEDFLAGMEGGIDSKVGENGQLLSGGQRQRIAVARALIRRTPVLILDEGTSAIDRETAFEIEKRLLERRELTVITITHHMDERLEGEYDGILRLGV
ncbi:ABC transporter ATP-binding protein [Blautia marasmi]|uniref:ABC transporter ATP-binding protein n=1 Tax=Blautia marasmi TaxID=1917868 RepID=UPI000CF2D2FA|nr:ABC transporter ATP-binding protein [Blautia marasmi]